MSSIQEAVRRVANVVVTHEAIEYHAPVNDWQARIESGVEMDYHQKRLHLLAQHKLVVYRIHSSWDALLLDGVPDQAVRALELSGVKVKAAENIFGYIRLVSRFQFEVWRREQAKN